MGSDYGDTGIYRSDFLGFHHCRVDTLRREDKVKCYVLNLASGGETIDIWAEDMETAMERAEESLLRLCDVEGEVVWAEQADANGEDDDGETCYRLLAWASESDAENDSGRKSIAQLEWTGD